MVDKPTTKRGNRQLNLTKDIANPHNVKQRLTHYIPKYTG